MSILYSTGPLENAVANKSVRVAVKALNNSHISNAKITITAFSLDGTKHEIFNDSFTLAPQASGFRFIDVSNLVEFEIEIKVRSFDADNVLVSVFGEDQANNLVSAHRLVQSELTVIHD